MTVEGHSAQYGTINVESYRAEMDRLLVKHGYGPDNLVLVDSFPDDPNPHRVLKCFKIEKKIMFKRVITPEDRAEAIASLDLFKDRVGILKDGWTFVKLFLLTEIHRITYRYKSDHECRLWAFHEVKF